MTDNKSVSLPAAFYDGDDSGFACVGAIRGPRISYLRFNGKTGEYTLNGEPVPPGRRYIVAKASYGYLRLVAGEPVERILQEPGKPLITRDDLPDRDQRFWPTSMFTKERVDPWKDEVTLLMADPETGVPVIFSITTSTGITQVSDLCRLMDFGKRQRTPRHYPIVEFATGSFTGQYGVTPIPVFSIMGWIEADKTLELSSRKAPDATAELQKCVIDPTAQSTSPQPRGKKAKDPWDDDLDDEIKY
jgi:hypothetical protein